jgi:hyperosmotically inducible protein
VRAGLLTTCLAALALTGTAGCVPVLIGGAAAAGYYIGKDPRSAAEIATDSGITTRVKSSFIGDRYVDAFDINVDTFRGTVILEGTVAHSIARDQAERLARGVSGVQAVDNRITIDNSASKKTTSLDED